MPVGQLKKKRTKSSGPEVSDNTVKFRKKPRDVYFLKAFLMGLYLEGLMYGGKFAFQNRLG